MQRNRAPHGPRGLWHLHDQGEPKYNRELYCPDWIHLIRSQAFANLWMKALKAHEECLTAVRTMGTDELHVVGNWPRFFTEGRGGSEVKVKDTYTAEAAGDEALQPGEGGVRDHLNWRCR